MTLGEYKQIASLATEWAFYGRHTSQVYPKGYGGGPPDEIGGVDKSEYGYRLFEDALTWIEVKRGRMVANVARAALHKWYADGIEPHKGTETRDMTIRVIVRAHEIHQERAKVFEVAA